MKEFSNKTNKLRAQANQAIEITDNLKKMKANIIK